MDYKAGDYFGELALLKDEPRAASVRITSDSAKLLVLDRRSFKRLLGPLQDLLKKTASQYK
jgi:cAMP-dependent protein kinase regulator